MLGMSVRTLANWRSTGKGPPYLKIGVEPPEGHQTGARSDTNVKSRKSGHWRTGIKGRWRDEKRHVRSSDTDTEQSKCHKRRESTRRHRQTDPHAARNRHGQVHSRKPRAHRKTQKGDELKHEYTDSELAELKNIYDEQGEAGLSITGMRAYARPDSSRKAFRRNRRNRRNAISSSRTAKNASTKANRSTARKPPKRSA